VKASCRPNCVHRLRFYYGNTMYNRQSGLVAILDSFQGGKWYNKKEAQKK
jgi:hypothetical protein